MKTNTFSPKTREVETPDRPIRTAPETPAETPVREFTGPSGTYRAIWLNTAALALVISMAGSMSAQTTMPNTTTQPRTTSQDQGWMMFDDKTGSTLKLKDEQVKQLRAVDGRYQERYKALGGTPWTNDGYNALSDSRDNDYRGVLTPAQYEQWDRTYGRGRLSMPKPAMRDERTTPTTPKQ